MKIQNRTANEQRLILIGMITSRQVLGKIASRWEKKEGLFESPWANLVGKWAVEFFQKYDKAPMRAVQASYESWLQGNPDEHTAQLVEDFIKGISNEYARSKQMVPDHITDVAGIYFEKVKAKRLKDSIEALLENNEVEKVGKLVDGYQRINLGEEEVIDLLNDREAARQAIESQSEPLIRYKGPMGDCFGSALEREGFVALQAPEKRGKTFWLIDIAWRGMLQGNNVWYFACGDMTHKQMSRRFQARASLVPLKPGTIKWPTEMIRDPDSKVSEVTWQEKTYKTGLTSSQGYSAFQKAQKKKGAGKIFLSEHPNGTMTTAKLKDLVAMKKRTGWRPDVLVIDYADLLAAPQGGIDSRSATDLNWKALRSMAQQFHCLVVTATQAKAESYDVETLDRSHFSEDKRKNAHVSALFGLNVTNADKARQITRVNRLQFREEDFDETVTWHAAGCLALSNPCVKSSY